jgi:hypothetical protein
LGCLRVACMASVARRCTGVVLENRNVTLHHCMMCIARGDVRSTCIDQAVDAWERISKTISCAELSTPFGTYVEGEGINREGGRSERGPRGTWQSWGKAHAKIFLPWHLQCSAPHVSSSASHQPARARVCFRNKKNTSIAARAHADGCGTGLPREQHAARTCNARKAAREAGDLNDTRMKGTAKQKQM